VELTHPYFHNEVLVVFNPFGHSDLATFHTLVSVSGTELAFLIALIKLPLLRKADMQLSEWALVLSANCGLD
jgi:hypothetical protein